MRQLLVFHVLSSNEVVAGVSCLVKQYSCLKATASLAY